MNRIKIATTVRTIVACIAFGLMAMDAKPADKKADVKDAKEPAEKIDKMFPDGLGHDFGKVPHGIVVKHAFRVVNTSNAPLRIVNLRFS